MYRSSSSLKAIDGSKNNTLPNEHFMPVSPQFLLDYVSEKSLQKFLQKKGITEIQNERKHELKSGVIRFFPPFQPSTKAWTRKGKKL